MDHYAPWPLCALWQLIMPYRGWGCLVVAGCEDALIGRALSSVLSLELKMQFGRPV